MPRIATVTGAAVVAGVLAVVFTRPDGGGGGQQTAAGEVILEPTGSTGEEPFTPSTANATTALPAAAPRTAPTAARTLTSVAGSEPGLYGGSRNLASCDVEKQIRYLGSDPAKNRAFASALKVEESAVPGYLRSLTPVQLRSDTRVTNHGYRNGAATGYQAVLQSGTAVLVDSHGEPKVRCACGNPLSRAVPQAGTPEQKGKSWPGYRPQNVVVVNRSETAVKVFVIFDQKDRQWVSRYSGDHGKRDRKAEPPPKHWPLPPTAPPATEPPATKSPHGTRDPHSPGHETRDPRSPGKETRDPQTPGRETGKPESPAPESPASERPGVRESRPPAPESPDRESPSAPASPERPNLRDAETERPDAPSGESPAPEPTAPPSQERPNLRETQSEPPAPEPSPVQPSAPAEQESPAQQSPAPEGPGEQQQPGEQQPEQQQPGDQQQNS
ncbi:DUF6777 domain-containing protein [Streptomyces sp. 2P-4]|uniref:DUF6777 domain-containing protein n=1 Tax=Streptomyces sp. 2P-4 TaxID=2931974 RepID=UPI00254141A2|nr:DUF6777 domain-containing protein [Streptomyces sp. 2P-4]